MCSRSTEAFAQIESVVDQQTFLSHGKHLQWCWRPSGGCNFANNFSQGFKIYDLWSQKVTQTPEVHISSVICVISSLEFFVLICHVRVRVRQCEYWPVAPGSWEPRRLSLQEFVAKLWTFSECHHVFFSKIGRLGSFQKSLFISTGSYERCFNLRKACLVGINYRWAKQLTVADLDHLNPI